MAEIKILSKQSLCFSMNQCIHCYLLRRNHFEPGQCLAEADIFSIFSLYSLLSIVSMRRLYCVRPLLPRCIFRFKYLINLLWWRNTPLCLHSCRLLPENTLCHKEGWPLKVSIGSVFQQAELISGGQEKRRRDLTAFVKAGPMPLNSLGTLLRDADPAETFDNLIFFSKVRRLRGFLPRHAPLAIYFIFSVADQHVPW